MALFYNYTKEDFKTTWDKHAYTFKAGQVYVRLAIADDGVKNVELTDTVCRVFSHHLAHKVLNTPSLDINFVINEKGHRESNDLNQMQINNFNNVELLIQRGLSLPGESVSLPSGLSSLPLMQSEAVSEVPAEVKETIEEAVEEKPKAKIGRPKKAENSPSENAEFAI